MRKHDIQMYNSPDGVVRFKGYISYFEEEEKEIIVDGERYVNKKRVNKKVTVDEMRNDPWMDLHFHTEKYYLNGFGSVLTIEDNNVFYSSLSSMCQMDSEVKYVGSSDNEHVNTFLKAYKYGFVNPIVKNVSFGKQENLNFKRWWNQIMSTLEIEICIHDYGWNNGLYVHVSLEDFLNFNHKETSELHIDLFKENGINLKSSNEFIKIQSLIKNKINYETSKQQKSSSIFI